MLTRDTPLAELEAVLPDSWAAVQACKPGAKTRHAKIVGWVIDARRAANIKSGNPKLSANKGWGK